MWIPTTDLLPLPNEPSTWNNFRSSSQLSTNMGSFLVHRLAPIVHLSPETVQVSCLSPFTFDSGMKTATNGKEMYREGVGTGRDENYIRPDLSHYRRPQNDTLTEKVQLPRYRRVYAQVARAWNWCTEREHGPTCVSPSHLARLSFDSPSHFDLFSVILYVSGGRMREWVRIPQTTSMETRSLVSLPTDFLWSILPAQTRRHSHSHAIS
ncbi:uncharacterized protein ARMOST_02908 [Armillaria ostoyae]|uniref:Uncharacterized protein n=1 Tax=Armillaria ostoyae TaxID=47428 RepID=A0A284QT05_ARMOS|nr:uncharacterized protein ARMOST_02908 [Armillaria ostoyae]